MTIEKAKEWLKCAVLAALFLLIVLAGAISFYLYEDAMAAKRALPGLIAETKKEAKAEAAAQINALVKPLVDQYAATGRELAATAKQANGLIADLRHEIPTGKESLQVEVTTLNGKLDTLNASAWQLAHPLEPLQPTIDGLNLMFRRDAVPAQTLGLLAGWRITGGEVAQTMKTVRDTVNAEAVPTALAVQKSAEGTANTTAATARLIDHVDDLFFGPKTFWQKVKGWLALLAGPAAIAATR